MFQVSPSLSLMALLRDYLVFSALVVLYSFATLNIMTLLKKTPDYFSDDKNGCRRGS